MGTSGSGESSAVLARCFGMWEGTEGSPAYGARTGAMPLLKDVGARVRANRVWRCGKWFHRRGRTARGM
jgi:hypothetical protein